MIDKSESVNWPNVWWILGADHLTSEGLWVISEKNVLHTAHAPSFNFRTGCREIKRCEESKRTLKNPFALRLAEFDTILKLLRITDQWFIVPVKFRFGRNRVFYHYFYCCWLENQMMGSALISFLPAASIQAQIIVKGIRRNGTATIETVRRKPLRHWCDWKNLVELSFVNRMFCNEALVNF